MNKIFSLVLVLAVSQINLTSNDFSYKGKEYSLTELSEEFYHKIVDNYSFTTWSAIKSHFFLFAAVKCYENMDKSNIRLSSKAKYELQEILNASNSWFGHSWECIRFKCQAFCLMYGGYLVADFQGSEEIIKSIKEEVQDIKKLITALKK